MDTVNLYTRQHGNSLYELNNKGEIRNKEIYVRLHMRDIFDFFDEKYKIFVDLANKIIPKPDNVSYPIWCSVSKKSCLKPIDNEIVYCLEVPKSEVIYFDGTKWDYVLNNLYIPKNEEDRKAYEQEVKALSVSDAYHFIDGKYKGLFPEMEKKIRDSWQRIFEIEEWNEFSVQANLWHIKKEWVKHMVRDGEDFFDITKDMEDTFPPF